MFYLILFPFLELWLLIELGSRIGGFTTIVWIVLSAMIGVNLLRLIGFEQVNQYRRDWQNNAVDSSALSTVLKVAGAVAIIIPGFISDTIGVLLLIPPIRNLMVHILFSKQASKPRRGNERQTIEGQFKRED